MDTSITLCGQLAPWPSKAALASVLRAQGLKLTVGRYSIRIDACEHFVFQEFGGDLGSPQLEADADSLEQMLNQAERVSDALTAADIRHRFELHDVDRNLVSYLHHKWPRPTDA